MVQVDGLASSISVTEPMAALSELQPDTEYLVNVYALDTSENQSPIPVSLSFTTQAIPAPPINENEVLVSLAGLPTAILLENYGSASDKGSATVLDDTVSVEMNGNTWNKLEVDYTITRNTRISFDYSSSIRGERQGVGFSSRNFLTSTRFFDLHGTEKFGKKDFHNYQSLSPGIVRYDIPVGQYYSGPFKFLVLVNDHDRRPANGQSVFSNVAIYEGME